MKTAPAGERGSVTLWILGMVLIIFLVGGLAVDLWRGLAAHRSLAALADSAAVAGASGIDPDVWRQEGRAVLHPGLVEERARAAATAQPGSDTVVLDIITAADGSSAAVTAVTSVDLTLLGIFVDEAFTVQATATAVPSTR